MAKTVIGSYGGGSSGLPATTVYSDGSTSSAPASTPSTPSTPSYSGGSTGGSSYTPQQVAQINAQREANYNAGLDPYTGQQVPGATPYKPPGATPATPVTPATPATTSNLADTIAQNVLNRMNQTQTQQQGYKVPTGSNLNASAQAMGITLQQLLEANPEYKTNPNMVQAGAMLKYPGGSTPSGQNNATEANLTLQNDLQSQLTDTLAKVNALKQYGLTDTNQLTKDASGNYVPISENEETPFDDILKQYGLDSDGMGMMTIDQIIQKVSDAFGLKDVKTEMTNLSNDLSEEVMDINENPWLSEQSRQEKINRTTEKFESKKNAIYERLKAEQPMVSAALDLYQQQQTSRQQILLQAMRDASEKANQTTSDIQNYQFYSAQEKAAGRTPKDFSSWTKVQSTTQSPSPQIIKSGNMIIPEGAIATGQSKLDTSRGTDTYANTGIYLEMLKRWKADGGLEQDFFNYYPPKNYLNPNDPTIPQYIKDKLKATDSFDNI